MNKRKLRFFIPTKESGHCTVKANREVSRKSSKKTCLIFFAIFSIHQLSFGQLPPLKKGQLIYENDMATSEGVQDWVMEGPGKVLFAEGWMEMLSPDEKYHHVLWCPEDFPGSFIAEWEAQNLKLEAGLCIIFFSAKGKNGQDIFEASFPPRDGTFRQYTKSDYLNTYHISYYANGKDNPGREISHLRKNSGFHLVQELEPGIPLESTAIHKLTLVKDNERIRMFVDGRKIIDWIDNKEHGPVLQDGKIGFRQMQWTYFRYRNFKVWEISK